MSLKVYLSSYQLQDYKKEGSGDLLVGLQGNSNTRLSNIYSAYWDTNDTVTEINAIKLDDLGNEIDSKSLSNDLIFYDTNTKQYLTDFTKSYELDLCIYYITFSNGIQTFNTEPFEVFNDADFHIVSSDILSGNPEVTDATLGVISGVGIGAMVIEDTFIIGVKGIGVMVIEDTFIID